MNDFLSIVPQCRGGARFSRVGLHGGRGLALALGGWRGKGRVISGRTSMPGQRWRRRVSGAGGQSGTVEVTSLLLHFLLVAMCARPHLPESLAFYPASPPSPQAVVWSDLASTWAALGTGTVASPRGPQGPSRLLLGPRQGPARALILPRPGHPSLLCLACWAPPIPATPVLCRPPPSASGLISVSFALSCSLTGIIKIRINREVSISLLFPPPVCLTGRISGFLTISGCLSLSLVSVLLLLHLCAQHQPSTSAAWPGAAGAESLTRPLL